MKIINSANNAVLATDALLADRPLLRIKGLLGRKEFKPTEALILKPCNSIHTFFMRFPIDVLFIDQNNKIIFLENNLLPWRFSPIIFKAKFVIELPSGVIKQTGTHCADEIKLG